jgi:D-alanine-D-alanine ligase
MTNAKTQIAILCGGQSAEHEVSLRSAKNIIQALNKVDYEIFVIVVSMEGEWFCLNSADILLNNPDMQTLDHNSHGQQLLIKCGSPHPFVFINSHLPLPIDVVFPVLHGTHGEDGTLQGLMELINLPYVGSGTLASALAMDKETSKRLLQAAGIPVAKWCVATQNNIAEFNYPMLSKLLGSTIFVKPCNTGSSVGISKVKNAESFQKAVDLAFHYDNKILFEEFVEGREIECAVLGNETIEASLPGEIITHHDFYSYEAKYLDPNGADLKIPAELPETIIHDIQNLAKKTYAALCCEGMARIDFFLSKDNKLIVNEANTIPGFTQISMYPKMWEQTKLPYSMLIDKLIQLAKERFARNRVLVEQRCVALKKGQ